MDEKKKENRAELIRTVKFVLFSISAGVIELGTFTVLYEVLHWARPSYVPATYAVLT